MSFKESDPETRAPVEALTIPRAFQDILVAAWRDVRRQWQRWSALWVTALVLAATLYPYDRPMLRTIQNWGVGSHELAGTLSTIGRFENSSLLFAVILGAVGILLHRPRWRQAAVACLLAGIVAGLAVTVLRPSLGRARPHSEEVPGFYFFELDEQFHSMPSGHASTNVASAVAIARALPPLALPSLVYAGGVAWSRLQLNRHHPSDILMGITLGGTIGWSVAGAIVGRRRRDPSRSNEPS